MPRSPAETPDLLEIDAPEATRRTLIAIAALGVAFDLTFNGQRPGIAIPILALVLCAWLRSIARRSASTDVLLGIAALISFFPALRASPELAVLDVVGASALLGLVATQDIEPIASATVPGLVRRALAVPRRALEVPRYVAAPFTLRADSGLLRVAIRTTLIVVPVVALFAGLLASGDRVFAHLLSSFLPHLSIGNAVSHVAITSCGAALIAVLRRTAIGRESVGSERLAEPRRPILAFPEWAAVLAGLDLLFAAFVVVQLEYLFGGNRRVDVTPGLTYAEYARSGFFQLAAAAALTVLVILAAWDAGRRDHAGHERIFRALVTTMVGLTGIVLASAVMRLALYEGTFGFTIKRFFGYVIIVSIGAALLVLLATIWTSRREHLVAGLLVVCFAALIAVNILDPDRFVAAHNAARFEATGKVDAAYLGTLGPDAVPVTIGVLSRLPRAEAETLRRELCDRVWSLGPEPSWRSINLGRARARAALATARITSLTCKDKPPPA